MRLLALATLALCLTLAASFELHVRGPAAAEGQRNVSRPQGVGRPSGGRRPPMSRNSTEAEPNVQSPPDASAGEEDEPEIVELSEDVEPEEGDSEDEEDDDVPQDMCRKRSKKVLKFAKKNKKIFKKAGKKVSKIANRAGRLAERQQETNPRAASRLQLLKKKLSKGADRAPARGRPGAARRPGANRRPGPAGQRPLAALLSRRQGGSRAGPHRPLMMGGPERRQGARAEKKQDKAMSTKHEMIEDLADSCENVTCDDLPEDCENPIHFASDCCPMCADLESDEEESPCDSVECVGDEVCAVKDDTAVCCTELPRHPLELMALKEKVNKKTHMMQKKRQQQQQRRPGAFRQQRHHIRRAQNLGRFQALKPLVQLLRLIRGPVRPIRGFSRGRPQRSHPLRSHGQKQQRRWSRDTHGDEEQGARDQNVTLSDRRPGMNRGERPERRPVGRRPFGRRDGERDHERRQPGARRPGQARKAKKAHHLGRLLKHLGHEQDACTDSSCPAGQKCFMVHGKTACCGGKRGPRQQAMQRGPGQRGQRPMGMNRSRPAMMMMMNSSDAEAQNDTSIDDDEVQVLGYCRLPSSPVYDSMFKQRGCHCQVISQCSVGLEDKEVDAEMENDDDEATMSEGEEQDEEEEVMDEEEPIKEEEESSGDGSGLKEGTLDSENRYAPGQIDVDPIGYRGNRGGDRQSGDNDEESRPQRRQGNDDEDRRGPQRRGPMRQQSPFAKRMQSHGRFQMQRRGQQFARNSRMPHRALAIKKVQAKKNPFAFLKKKGAVRVMLKKQCLCPAFTADKEQRQAKRTQRLRKRVKKMMHHHQCAIKQ